VSEKTLDEQTRIAMQAISATDAIHINFHSVITMAHGVRISFGEGSVGDPSWKSAVFMSPADALLLKNNIENIFANEPELKAQAEKRVSEIAAEQKT
jgi:hypothetical protein